jgi:hypothetical protein
MSQPKQIIYTTPNNDWNQIDNSAAPTFPTISAGTSLGYDTGLTGANSQGSNLTADTGTTTLDAANDQVYADPSCSTFAGNPVSQTAPTYKTVTTALQDSTKGIFIKWKNPA